jgi:hypothetical protein
MVSGIPDALKKVFQVCQNGLESKPKIVDIIASARILY